MTMREVIHRNTQEGLEHPAASYDRDGQEGCVIAMKPATVRLNTRHAPQFVADTREFFGIGKQ